MVRLSHQNTGERFAMSERRTNERKYFPEQLKLGVIDRAGVERIGYMVNISMDGLMVISHRLIEMNKIWQFEMELPFEENGESWVHYEAESLWCEPTLDDSQFFAGFQIIDASEQTINKIQYLMSEYL